MAQDAVRVAPDIYKVLLENDRVRVLDVRMKPGGMSSMHSHPAYVIYSLANAKVKFTSPGGESAEVEIGAGQALWREAESHAVDNLGSTEVHVMLVELK